MMLQLSTIGIVLVLLSAGVVYAIDPHAADGVVTVATETATPKPMAMPEPSPPPPPEPAPPAANPANRADCDAIRGTTYLSPEERTWYLENCVRR